MKYNGHLYKWTCDFEWTRHHWELRSQNGGIHFHVTIPPDERQPTAGLEFHSVTPEGEDAPDLVDCWLTGGRCWHDGTSLYATETLWPRIKLLLNSGNHPMIFKILENELKTFEENLKPNHL